MTGPGPGPQGAGDAEDGDELEPMTPVEVIEAFCDLDPVDAWDAFRAVAEDPFEPEERRIRAAGWLAIANAISAYQQPEED
jgi:hypothetical protein